MKKNLLKILGVSVPLFFYSLTSDGQTTINRTNSDPIDPFTKTIVEDKGNIYVEYTDSLFADNNGHRGELLEVDNRQITDHKGDNNLLGKKDILALQQTQPGQYDSEGKPIVSDFVFHDYIFTDNNKGESLKQVTDKEIAQYEKYMKMAATEHKRDNMQKTFYNDLDRSGSEVWNRIQNWIGTLEKEKDLPLEEKTLYMIGPIGEGPEITRGIAEDLYLEDKEGNKKTLLMKGNELQIIIENAQG